MWNATAQLNTIPKNAFQKCFQQWHDRWNKCVHYQGDYFEGDYSKFVLYEEMYFCEQKGRYFLNTQPVKK
jgi:hypothetical protein